MRNHALLFGLSLATAGTLISCLVWRNTGWMVYGGWLDFVQLGTLFAGEIAFIGGLVVCFKGMPRRLVSSVPPSIFLGLQAALTVAGRLDINWLWFLTVATSGSCLAWAIRSSTTSGERR